MSEARAPRSRFYDGAPYAAVMDRFSVGLRAIIAKEVGGGKRMLDVGSGTGSVVMKLAENAEEVVGVELSPAMAEYATLQAKQQGLGHVSFLVGDVNQVFESTADDYFDAATMVLVLHEMPAEARVPVLREVTRVAQRLICVDFRVPMPWNVAGVRNRFFELAAGAEHFRAFQDFNARGGIAAIAEQAGLAVRHLRFVDGKTLDISEVTTN